jgi:phage terminase small subunit
MAKGKLTPREKRFVQYYVELPNASRAARLAGYAHSVAPHKGYELLKKDHVRAAVDRGLNEIEKRHDLKVNHMVEKLLAIAGADHTEAFDEHGNIKPREEWPQELRVALVGWEVAEHKTVVNGESTTVTRIKKAKFERKQPAINDLMRFLGGFEKDNSQVGDALRQAIIAMWEAKQ